MAFSRSNWDKETTASNSDPLQKLSASLAKHIPMAAMLVATILPSEKVDAAPATNPFSPEAPAARLNVSKAVAVRVGNSGELLSKWTEEQNLYICGDVGVGDKQANELAAWLRQYPNWTVFLTHGARSERYNDGVTTYTGLDAIERRLNQLPKKTDLGAINDARLGTPNGVIFYISLDDQRDPNFEGMGYFPSSTHNSYGVGDAAWQGGLAEPVKTCMRDGQRIIDAVKAAAQGVEGHLSKAIAARVEQARAAAAAKEAEAKRIQDGAASAVASVDATRGDLPKVIQEFKVRYPLVSGPIVKPDLRTIDMTIAEARSLLQSKQYQGAAATAGKASESIATVVKALEDYPAGQEVIKSTAKALEGVERSKLAGRYSKEIEAAKDIFSAASKAWERGDATYQTQLNDASRAVANLTKQISRAETAAAVGKSVTIGGTTLSLVAFFGITGFMFRRARAAKASTEKHIREWEELQHKKFEKLQELDGRLEVLSAVVKDNYCQGRTKEVAKQIIDDLASLWSYQAFTNKALEKAKALLTPSFTNTFRTTNYNAAQHLLKNVPIEFEGSEELEALVEKAGRKSNREKNILSAGLKDVAPFKLTFDELQAAYKTTSDRLEANLAELEKASETVSGLLKGEREKLGLLQTGVKGLRVYGDRLFQLEQFEGSYLPAATAAIEAAAGKIERDPLGASDTAHATAESLGAANQLITLIAQAREPKGELTEIQNSAKLLKTQGLECPWIEKTLENLSADAEKYLVTLAGGEGKPGIKEIRVRLEELGKAALEAVNTAQDAGNTQKKGIETAEKNVAHARTDLALKLGIAEVLVLHEEKCDPSVELERASSEIATTLDNVNKGNLPEAAEHLSTAKELNKRALTLLHETERAFNNYQNTLTVEEGLQSELLKEVRPHETLLAKMQAQYSESALKLGSGDPTHPRANDILSDNVKEAQTALFEAKEAISQAKTKQTGGRILEAQFYLKQAGQFHAAAKDRFAEIDEKNDRIKSQLSNNEERKTELRKAERTLVRDCQDPQVMQETLKLCQEFGEALNDFDDSLTEAKLDPFKGCEILNRAQEAAQKVTRLIQADKALYEEAVRSGDAAAGAINKASQALGRSQNDNVPDGSNLDDAERGIPQLERALRLVREGLKTPHGNWKTLDKEADRVYAEALRISQMVKEHVEAGESAISAMSSAKSAVSGAQCWHSSWNVSISSSVGRAELSRGQQYLSDGDYDNARRCFAAAAREAAQAIEEAEREARRRKDAYEREQERQAEERRARERAAEAARRSTWESSNSGFSRSSISTSNTGFSRSSW